MKEVQRHDVSLATLQVHVLVAHGRLMSAPLGILDHELELWQSLWYTLVPVCLILS